MTIYPSAHLTSFLRPTLERRNAFRSRQDASLPSRDPESHIRVGKQIWESASWLFERSKKTPVEDGTYIGFVNAVLGRIPNTSMTDEDASSFGYPIHARKGPLVTETGPSIMPGDIITIRDATLEGRKGVRNYQQTIGVESPVVAVVGEYEEKKSKVKAYQASGHVGNQVRHTLNSASIVLMHTCP